ncbi:MAG: DNA internalization-related competence protein ComEC/Rec2 [Candidatus Binataceae bacterium]
MPATNNRAKVAQESLTIAAAAYGRNAPGDPRAISLPGASGGSLDPGKAWSSGAVAPIYAVAIAIASGDAAGNLGRAMPLWLAIALGAAAFGAFLSRRRTIGLWAAYLAIACAATIPSARLLHPVRPPDSIRNFKEGAPVTIEGRLIREAEHMPYGVRLYASISRAAQAGAAMRPASGVVRLAVLGGGRFRAGDEIEAAAPLRFPRNDGDPGEFDYAAYMARAGIDATMTVRPKLSGRHFVRVLGHFPSFPAGEIESVRIRIGDFIDRNLPYPESAEMRALVIGDRGGIPQRLRDTFARTGMAHLLVISGLHLSIVAGVVFALVRLAMMLMPGLANRGYGNKAAAIAASIAACAYAAIAGHHVSTERALVMVLAYTFAIAIDRAREALAAMALAAIVICLAMPGSTADIGFQLSFASVIAIALGMRRFTAYFAWRKRWRGLPAKKTRLRWTLAEVPAGFVAVSFWAMIGTAPLTAFHFNQLAIVGVVANAVVVPIMGFGATICGLAAAASSFISNPAARAILSLGGTCIATANSLAEYFLHWPMAWMRTFTPTPIELVLVYGLLLVWLTAPLAATRHPVMLKPLARDVRKWDAAAADRALPGWRTLCAGALGVLLAADAAMWMQDRYFNPDLRVTFLSVGEGDAAVIRFPGSRVMLIDAGAAYPGFDSGERIVAPYLWSQKIMRVDFLVLSHPDADHFGGFKFIAGNFHPRSFWTTGERSPDESYAALMEALARDGVPVLRLNGDLPMNEIGGVAIASLNHPAPGASNNNGSLVMRLDFGRESYLFTGDIEAPAEHAMIAQGADLRAAVLKVPHHGSATSSTAAFIATVHPALAIISDGWLNRFHFPAPGVLDRYRAAGTELMRTDLDGAVTVDEAPSGAIGVQAWRGESMRIPAPAHR